MGLNRIAFEEISEELKRKRVSLVAVSKTKPVEDLLALYTMGHRDFGENYVQEMGEKHSKLPDDIRWHFIGHLQSNKVKNIAPFVEMIHGVDSFKLLKEINKQGAKLNKKIKCLLQIHIASEETKFGLDESELNELAKEYSNAEEFEFVDVCGLMGMASFSENSDQIHKEFQLLRRLFDDVKEKYFYHFDSFKEISMGMSSDYKIAIEEGSTIVRIGSLIFGERV